MIRATMNIRGNAIFRKYDRRYGRPTPTSPAVDVARTNRVSDRIARRRLESPPRKRFEIHDRQILNRGGSSRSLLTTSRRCSTPALTAPANDRQSPVRNANREDIESMPSRRKRYRIDMDSTKPIISPWESRRQLQPDTMVVKSTTN